MSEPTKSELFIAVLTEFVNTERQRRRARRKQIQNAFARRPLQAFPADFDESRIMSEWTPQYNQPTQESVRQLQAE